MPFELGRFIFPGIQKNRQPHLSSWDLEKKEEKSESESILLFEYSICFNLLFIYLFFTLQYFIGFAKSKTASYFAKLKKNLVFQQGNQCEKLRSATLNISGEFITEEMLPLYSCVHG